MFADQLAVFKKRLVGRVNDDQAVEPVQQSVLAAVQLAAGHLQADCGRDAQRAGHDGGMRGSAADIGGEAKHHFLVQLRSARRC